MMRQDRILRVCVLASSIALASGCMPGNDRSEKTVAKWSGPKIAVRVTERRSFPKFISTLYVETEHGVTSGRLDDDAILGAVRLVHYRNWLFVVNDDYVLGGFDLDAGKIVGENEWDALPFTQWSGQGLVLALANPDRQGQGGMPMGFEFRAEGKSTTAPGTP